MEDGPPLFPGDRLLVSLVRGRGAEFEMSLSLLCSVRASCLSLVNLGLGVSQDSEGGGLVAQVTEVHQTEPQHSVQGPSVHCPCNSQDSAAFPLTLTPHILPLSPESAFFRWHLGDPRICAPATMSRGCLSSWGLQDLWVFFQESRTEFFEGFWKLRKQV